MLAGVEEPALPASAGREMMSLGGRSRPELSFPKPRAANPGIGLASSVPPPLRRPRSLPLSRTRDLGETFSDLHGAGPDTSGAQDRLRRGSRRPRGQSRSAGVWVCA